MTTTPLLDWKPPPGDRDGATYEPKRDRVRLNAQAQAVWDVISDGRGHTLAEISEMTGHPQASISARLRDFRKPRFGGHKIERQYIKYGIWVYRVGE